MNMHASVIEDGVKSTGEERKDVNSTHEGLGTPEFGALSSKPTVIKAFQTSPESTWALPLPLPPKAAISHWVPYQGPLEKTDSSY